MRGADARKLHALDDHPLHDHPLHDHPLHDHRSTIIRSAIIRSTIPPCGAEVGRYPDGGKPYTVDLELASPVTVAALVAVSGAYRQNRTDRGMPREIVLPAAGRALGGGPPGAATAGRLADRRRAT